MVPENESALICKQRRNLLTSTMVGMIDGDSPVTDCRDDAFPLETPMHMPTSLRASVTWSQN